VAGVVASDLWTLTVPEVQVVVLMEAEVLQTVQNASQPVVAAEVPVAALHYTAQVAAE
jgi:hypothetical protein